MISKDCAGAAFTDGLNPNSFDASWKLKESMRDFPAKTWNEVNHRYIKLRIEDDLRALVPIEVMGRFQERSKAYQNSWGQFKPYSALRQQGQSTKLELLGVTRAWLGEM